MWEVTGLVRIITADGVTMSRLGYAAVIAECSDIELVAQASKVDEVGPLVRQLEPDAAVIDVELPGLEVARALRQSHPRLGVLLTGPASDDLVIQALERGLSGYLPRDGQIPVLLSAIRHAAAVPGSFTSPLIGRALTARRGRNPLSPREEEVLQLLATGASLLSIARQMQLTESTVRTYAARVYEKLDVRSRAEAMRCGLPDLPGH